MMTSVGLTCAICHVTVKPTPFQLQADADPVPLPIGSLVFGPPNTRMDAGLLLSFTPRVQSGSENVNIAEYQGWGPGRIDPRFFPNNPFNDGVFNPSSIPQHWNYLDLAEQGYAATWIGVLQTRPDNHSLASAPECGIDLVLDRNGAWGTANASIQDIEIGNPLPQEFLDKLEVAEITEPGNDLLKRDLLDVEAFLQSIVSPAPGPFDEVKAEQGWRLFYGKANCAACHSSGEGTGATGKYFTNIVENPPQGLLSIGIKTPGLRGLAFTAPYFHDGSAETLADVVQRYTSPDIPEVPNLSAGEQIALVEYLKSL
ncbi:Cytochrome c551 peroxidase [hydrothermal vent metagenome]|uniref:Cytochrome c551 peroxidase n=1 Tax=hydrothermal vent metagenome TaxID=652676 RepID=A0A3B0Y8X1_9ZZZZ